MSIALERRRYMGASGGGTSTYDAVGYISQSYTAFNSSLSGTGLLTSHTEQFTMIFEVPTGKTLENIEVKIYYNGTLMDLEDYYALVGISGSYRIATYSSYPVIGSACSQRYWHSLSEEIDFVPEYKYLTVSCLNSYTNTTWSYFSATCTLSNGGV